MTIALLIGLGYFLVQYFGQEYILKNCCEFLQNGVGIVGQTIQSCAASIRVMCFVKNNYSKMCHSKIGCVCVLVLLWSSYVCCVICMKYMLHNNKPRSAEI